MANEINFIYERVRELSNKDQASGYISPDEFNSELKQAQMDEINEQRNKYESGSITTDNLSSIKVSDNVSVSTSGIATKPSDYLFFDSAEHIYFYTDSRGNQKQSVAAIEQIAQNELATRLSSQLSPVSRYFPICTISGDNINVYPKTIGNINLYYIKKPLDPFWNYTLVDDEPVYAATGGSQTNPNDGSTNSTNIELSWNLVPALIRRVCSQIGIQVRQADLTQIMEQKQQINNI